ncbi:MAG: hypothetical protein NTU62_09475 [Spirochaetes bacterium]|nr:hypothetical protein [Spirochaetota bacterium]
MKSVKVVRFILVLCVLSSLSSCGSLQVGAPRDVDYSPAISELQGFITSEMNRLGIPCANIAIVDGSEDHAAEHGHISEEVQRPQQRRLAVRAGPACLVHEGSF